MLPQKKWRRSVKGKGEGEPLRKENDVRLFKQRPGLNLASLINSRLRHLNKSATCDCLSILCKNAAIAEKTALRLRGKSSQGQVSFAAFSFSLNSISLFQVPTAAAL